MGRITGPWRCFHCGEICATPEHAQEHFGGTLMALTACQLKSSDRHLITALREAEEQLVRYRAEDSDVLRAMMALEADHRQALIRAEEQGYECGMRDALRESGSRAA
jgi:hypothetical protein